VAGAPRPAADADLARGRRARRSFAAESVVEFARRKII
jgi:hypothetical protein